MTQTRHARLALLAAACLAAAPLAAANSGAAAVGARWLNLEQDPFSASLGGADAGWARGLDALASNPAGLALERGFEAALGDQAWDQDVSRQHLALGQGLDHAALGLDLNYINFGSIQEVDLVGGYPVEAGTLSPWAGDLALAYARGRGNGLSAGLSLKVLSEDLAGAAAETGAADLGLLYAQPGGPLGLGLSLMNLGGTLDGAPLPAQARLGASFHQGLGGSQGLLLLGDLLLTPTGDEAAAVMAGLEYRPAANAAFRAGYRTGQLNAPSGPSAGLGLDFGWLGLDYSYSLLNGLASQQMDLRLGFGGPSAPAPALAAAPAPAAAAAALPADPGQLQQAVATDLHQLLDALDKGDTGTAQALTEKVSTQYLPVRQAVAAEMKEGSVAPAVFSGEFQDARRSLQLMLQLDRNNAYTYQALGNVDWFLGDEAGAVENLRKAYLLDPTRDYLRAQLKRLGVEVPETAPAAEQPPVQAPGPAPAAQP
jgi:tetratricopeptide (TPR) repeat protein